MQARWINALAAVFFACCVALTFSPRVVYADDFGRIVHQIEVSYHVHRNYPFLMGCAGFVAHFWHVGGVKSLKLAIFEDQHLDGTNTDTKLDEIIQRASRSGWQPMVRSYSRHTNAGPQWCRSERRVYSYLNCKTRCLPLLVLSAISAILAIALNLPLSNLQS